MALKWIVTPGCYIVAIAVVQEDLALSREIESSHRKPPHHRRVGSGSEHRRNATRRRCAHPRANARAGEGAYGGAGLLFSGSLGSSPLLCRCAERKGEEKK